LNQVARLLSNNANRSNNNNQPKAADPKDYKASEYYQYDQYSYFDIEKEMIKYRLPQPSSLPNIDYTWSQAPPKPKNKQ
jgi:hypothetical protein